MARRDVPTYVPTSLTTDNSFGVDVDGDIDIENVDVDVYSARAVMEAAEAKMIEDPMDQKALDRLLEAQATYEAVGGLTQDRLVAQVQWEGVLSRHPGM